MEGFENIKDLYREIILDHYRNPRNSTVLADPDIEASEYNPFCGDRVSIQLKLRSDHIDDVSSQSEGCSICQASASLLSELLRGKTLQNTEALAKSFRELMQGENLPEEIMAELGDTKALSGVRKYPIRIKCALLAWVALEEGLRRFIAKMG